MKVCKNCNENKNVDDFGKYRNKCKKCYSENSKQHYQLNKHKIDKEKKNEKLREWRKREN